MSDHFNPSRDKTLRAHTVHSARLTISAQAVKFVLRLGSMFVLARILSPSDYGLMAMAAAVTTILGAIREAGLSSAAIQQPKITHEQISALFWLNLGLGLVVFAVLCGLSPVVAYFFKEQELLSIIPALGCVGIIGSLGIQHNALLQRRMLFKQLMIRDLIAQIAGVAAAITAALLGAGYWSLVIMELTSVSVSTITIWIASGWHPSRPGSLAPARPLIKFGANVMGATVIHHLSKGMDGIVMGYFFGSNTVGLYNRAQHLLSTPLGQVIAPIMSVVRPALSRAAENPERLKRVTREVLELVSFCCAGIVAILIPISEGLVRLTLGPQWLDAAPLFAALAPFAIVEPCAALLASVMVASGRPEAMLQSKLISLLAIAASLTFAVPWGPVAVACAYAGSGLLIRMPLFMWFVSRKTVVPFSTMATAMVPSIITGLVTVAISLLVRYFLPGDSTGTLNTLLLAGLGLIFYLLVSLATSPGRKALVQILTNARSLITRKVLKKGPPLDQQPKMQTT